MTDHKDHTPDPKAPGPSSHPLDPLPASLEPHPGAKAGDHPKARTSAPAPRTTPGVPPPIPSGGIKPELAINAAHDPGAVAEAIDTAAAGTDPPPARTGQPARPVPPAPDPWDRS